MSRPKRRTIKRKPEIKRQRGVVGHLYRHDGEQIVQVHGAVVGDVGFIFKKSTRYGGTPRSAAIVLASSLYTTKKEAMEAMKTRPGFAYTYGDELLPVQVSTSSDGRLAAFDENGCDVHCNKIFTDKREAVRHAMKELSETELSERRTHAATLKKIRNVAALAKRR